MAPPDPDFAAAAADFKKGGWVVSLLGVAGAMIRLLLSEERYNWVCWVKRAIAGGLVGVVLYFALHGTSIDPMYKSVILSMGGAISPQLFQILDEKLTTLIRKRKIQ